MNEFFEEGSAINTLDMSSVLKKTFLWLFVGIIISGAAAFMVFNSETLTDALYTSFAPMIILMIAELALVVILSRALNSLSYPMAIVGFIAYSIVNGLTLSCIFFVYELGSIINVFFMTAGVFGLMAFIGYTTNVDLSRIGNICMIGLVGIIIASLINLFIGSTGLDLIITVIGIVIFIGLTAYDIQKIKQYSENPAINSNENLPIICALTIYLDFINIFLKLLSLFGKRRD
ncbi:MAG: Bax inhibitor-1/YccA family protein [Clostridiales bacterium]|nr:Bax inhibitor-1/YccA family protein [Clostridiales bacterium]